MQQGAVASSLSGPLVCTHSYSGVTNQNRGAILMTRTHITSEAVQRERMVSLSFTFVSFQSVPGVFLPAVAKGQPVQPSSFLYRLCPFRPLGRGLSSL